MKEKIIAILGKTLPKGFNIIVSEYNGFGNDKYLKIAFSPNTKQTNNVRGQYPQLVSLSLCLHNMTLQPQIYGGNGGKCIYREIDPNHPKEKYLAMVSVNVPFRKPKKEEKFVLAAIERFAINYIKTLKENKEKLRYKDIVDYSFLD